MRTKDIGTVLEALWDARPKWYFIGIALGIKVTDLDVIKYENMRNPDECITEMLVKWLQNANSKPTWHSVVKALRSPIVDLTRIAEKIEGSQLNSDPKEGSDSEDSSKTHQAAVVKTCVQASPASSNTVTTKNEIAYESKTQQAAVVKTCDQASQSFGDTDTTKNETAYESLKDFRGLTDEQKEKLEMEYKIHLEKIQLKYYTLRNKFFNSLDKQQLPIKRLVDHLKELKVTKSDDPLKSAAALQSYESVLDRIEDLDNVKKLIDENSTFFDFRYLEHMIENVGSDSDRKQLENYKELFENYAKSSTYICPYDIGPTQSPNDIKLIVKLDSTNYEKIVELRLFECLLSEVLNVHMHELKLRSVKKGCIEMFFLIPIFVQEAIFPLSTEQEATLKELGVIKLLCGDYHFPRQVYTILFLSLYILMSCIINIILGSI